MSEIIFNTEHSLIDQSLSARTDGETTNGDGFGVGWYDQHEFPGMYKHIQPAWNDPNLKDLCIHTHSPMFLAHVRATTEAAVQRTNCHPFRYKRWLFVHNGLIEDFRKLRYEISTAVSPDLYTDIQGTTDSELMFFLALKFGMEEDVYGGVSRMVGLVEDVGRRHGIENPAQMSLGISDGESLYAFRYSTEHKSRSLYHSTDVATLRDLVPKRIRIRLDGVSDAARVIVSEPFADLPGAWEQIPESSFVTIRNGVVERREFAPTPVAMA